jgi:hypothetical protein
MTDTKSRVHSGEGFGALVGAEATYDDRRCDGYRTCSWCGSLHPQDFLRLRDERLVSGVDRSVDWKYGWPHKIYVDLRNPEPDKLYCVGGSYGGERDRDPGPSYVHISELSKEQLAIALRDGSIRGSDDRSPERAAWLLFGTRQLLHAKFYSVHTLEPFLSGHERQALFAIIGYSFEALDDGRIRWRAFDYGSAA